ATALQFQNANVLAVDLSLASLAYAKRKTQEARIDRIAYAQADILQLGALGRHFDVIESVGVLHHLADPFRAWDGLQSLLRPKGFMRLGFYSEIARRNIARARQLIAQEGFGSTSREIRRARRYLVGLDASAELEDATRAADFFSVSACRDL